MTKIKKGTSLGLVKCPACGKEAEVKVDKNGSPFTFCTKTHMAGDELVTCYFRAWWGNVAGPKFIAAYQAKEAAKQERDTNDGRSAIQDEQAGTGAGADAGGGKRAGDDADYWSL